jgi:hypothetical protein
MAKATVHMVLSTSGFGTRPSSHQSNQQHNFDGNYYGMHMFQAQNAHGEFRPQRSRPQFEHNMRDMFPDDTPEIRGFRNLGRPSVGAALSAQAAQAAPPAVPHTFPFPQQQQQAVPLPSNLHLSSTPPNMPMNMDASSPAPPSLFPHTAGAPASPFSPFAQHAHPHHGPTSFPDGPGGIAPHQRSASPTAMAAAVSPAAMSSVSGSTLSNMSNVAMSPAAMSTVSSSAMGSVPSVGTPTGMGTGMGTGMNTGMNTGMGPGGLPAGAAGGMGAMGGAGAPPGGIPNYDALGFHNDLDALLGEHTAAYSGHGGLSLGFDTEHDWNDGWGPDFMDGYWFGGGGGGWGGQQAEMEMGDGGDGSGM